MSLHPRAVSAQTRLAAVIGWPVEHSKSPAMHNAAFAATGLDAVYLALAVPPAHLAVAIAGLRTMGILGASVTVPHKEAVLPLCDVLSDSARKIGAVNTLEFRADGTLVGHNTDAAGYVRAFEEKTGTSLQGKSVVVLGAGGAARAVVAGVQEAGAATVHLVARTPASVSWMPAEPWTLATFATHLPDCDLLIDCTSMGLDAQSEAAIPAPIDVSLLPADATVSSLVYHRETALLAAARQRGLVTLDGAGMLVHQGALAFAYWTGREAPLAAMAKALAASPAKVDTE